MCLSIYNWPQSEWLKGGDRPPQAKIIHCCPWSPEGKGQQDLRGAPTVHLGLMPSTLSGGHEDLRGSGSEREGPL